MSRYNQGVLARKLVYRPCKPVRLLAEFDPLLGLRLQRGQASVAAVLDDDLETARRAEAVDGRSAEDVDLGVRDTVLQRRLQARGDGIAGQILRCALMEIVQHHVHGAEVRRVGVEQDRLAGDGDGVLDAGILAGDVLDLLHHVLRARAPTRNPAIAR